MLDTSVIIAARLFNSDLALKTHRDDEQPTFMSLSR